MEVADERYIIVLVYSNVQMFIVLRSFLTSERGENIVYILHNVPKTNIQE